MEVEMEREKGMLTNDEAVSYGWKQCCGRPQHETRRYDKFWWLMAGVKASAPSFQKPHGNGSWSKILMSDVLRRNLSSFLILLTTSGAIQSVETTKNTFARMVEPSLANAPTKEIVPPGDPLLFHSQIAGILEKPKTFVAPFSLPKFQPVLKECRLQWPTSYPRAVNDGEFENYAVESFHLVNDSYIKFSMEGKAKRCELRHLAEWASSETNERSLSATVQLPSPDVTTAGQFTFIQIHNKEFMNYEQGPLLRINWRRHLGGKSDWVWAAMRVALDPKDVKLFPLFPRPDGFFDIEVEVSNSTMTILYDGETVEPFDQYDIRHWDPMVTNVFKAGVYLDDGNAFTLFEDIRIQVWNRTEVSALLSPVHRFVL